MFGIGFQEMLIILVVVLIFFGPKRLPDLAKSLGKGIAEFKKASDEIRKGIDEAVKEGESADAAGGPAAPGAATPADGQAPQAQQPHVAASTGDGGGIQGPETPPREHDAAPAAAADAKDTPATGNPSAPPSAPAG